MSDPVIAACADTDSAKQKDGYGRLRKAQERVCTERGRAQQGGGGQVFSADQRTDEKEVRAASPAQGEGGAHQGEQQHLGGGVQKDAGRRCRHENERGGTGEGVFRQV